MKKKLTVILIFIMLGLVVLIFLPNYFSNTQNDEKVKFVVNNGDNLTTVSQKLYNKGVIRSKYWFKYKGSDIAAKLKPGEYAIPANTDIEEIYEILKKGGEEESVAITFPEGLTLYEFAQRVEEKGISTSDEFIDATNKYFKENSYDFNNDDNYFNMEGYLFPDTYNFGKDQTIDEIVEKLVDTMDKVFTEDDLAQMKELDLNKHKILTIASLIEREAENDEERQDISGVIYNRLKEDMPLQIDATVIYGKGEGREHTTRVLYSDLEKDNPYNTYKNEGLTPGPIASPGKESIHAALYPKEHDYLFYVLGEDGHVFAETYDEHAKNVEAYRGMQEKEKSELKN
ncbi:MAG TPA: endolytic transglycosylase MltG [Tissierellaceae bacterium]|nr:endolytic transglycosylase MltG [Tissierellaceae bacterium]